MKYLISAIFILFSTTLLAEENTDWIFDRLNIYTENDKYFGTDDGYSNGARATALYFIPKEDYAVYDLLDYEDEKTYSYITFSLANQIFTPTNTSTTSLITDDRPYAGWTYFETAIHKTTRTYLRSLSLKVGAVGPASGTQEIQNKFHEFIDSDRVNGWGNQLHNELGLNLKYTQKWIYFIRNSSDLEASISPFASAELGNIAINATAGIMARIGWNIPKDYGVSSIDIGADPGIPVYGEYENMRAKPWSFSFNLIAKGSAIARDMFLDGNTFSNSHSVNIKHFVANYGTGFTLRYKNVVVDMMVVETTKQFDLQKETHGIGTMTLSLLF